MFSILKFMTNTFVKFLNIFDIQLPETNITFLELILGALLLGLLIKLVFIGLNEGSNSVHGIRSLTFFNKDNDESTRVQRHRLELKRRVK